MGILAVTSTLAARPAGEALRYFIVTVRLLPAGTATSVVPKSHQCPCGISERSVERDLPVAECRVCHPRRDDRVIARATEFHFCE